MDNILGYTITDLVSNLLYYDRKEDEELPRGAIEEMISSKVVTVSDIVDKFRVELMKGLKGVIESSQDYLETSEGESE